MKWGLLSTARINGSILGGAAETGAAEVVAVASRERARAEAFAAAHGIARAHGSYEALLEDPEIDAVYIPLPNAMHVEWSIRALEAGKHVLCEKPLTRRAADADAAFDAASAAGRVLAEAFMWRHLPQTGRLRALLDEGAVGRLRAVRSSFTFRLADPRDFRLSPVLDGGSLMDVGCYCVSGARLVAGTEPVAVHGERVVGGGGVDVAFAGTLRFADDVLATFDCSFEAAPGQQLEAVGEEGSLFLANPWHGHDPVILVRRDGEPEERVECERANPYARQFEDFARAVEAGQGSGAYRDDAVGQARVIEALHASAEG